MSAEKPVHITWLGHATVLIQTAATTLLIDPFIEQNPKYPKHFELPKKIDYILLTHGHFDHVADAVPVAKKHGSTLVAIYELADYMAKQGVKQTIGMNKGGTVQVGDVAVSMVDAKHSSGLQDSNGTHYVGEAAGYVLKPQQGPVMYHAGDTTIFGDMGLIGEFYKPEVAMLPIGGHFTMGPREAALAASYLGAKVVLPLHFGTFPPLTGTPAELAKLVAPGVKVAQWSPGESF